MEFLLTLCLVLLFTKLAGHFCNRVGIPSVIGELLVGIIIGPALLGWVKPDEFMHYFSEIGVIILMFIAGLESDLELLKKYWRPALAVALMGILFPAVMGFGVGEIFNFSMQQSIFLGVLFSATSVSISVQVLKDLKKIDTEEGATILGAAVVDDIVVVLILGIMLSLMNQSSPDNGLPIWEVLLLKVFFFMVIFAASKWLVPRILNLSEKLIAIEAVSAFSLVICLGFAYFAEMLDMGAIIGAFFAGVAIAQTGYRKRVDEKLEPIGYAVFIPMFFVSIGLNMTFAGMSKHFLFILLLTVVAVVSKLVGGALGARFTGFKGISTIVIGSGMVSRGEMALIIAQVGLTSSFLSEEYYSSVIMVIILTTIIAPLLLKAAIVKQDTLKY
ncbi:cation:proton antiporter [Enterococcus sp. 5H]|uniref:cation:proton antiporter n=1 Tax=Enterococcus sp. 5H TaxID=1229490 RepID=UPI0023039310|nr:cation:proton antiporter [Enterococcus sp. 5H]MDA9472483.1 Na, H antiporter [Enterococcus sp. 5H]